MELPQGTSYPDQERGAKAIELYSPAAAIEKGNAQFGLEPGDHSAKGGLGHTEFPGRTADMLVASHSLKVTELKQIHRRSSHGSIDMNRCPNWSWTA